MCGINGFNFKDSDLLRRMHAATRHRGPDDEGLFEIDGVSLAHNRLSIIDLSPGGHQPMSTPDGRYTIVFNGEIYNYRELQRQLEVLGKKFVSQSDTEVLLQAFDVWGLDCLSKLNGIFAFALWDRENAELFLVRDPIGVKPLYYSWRDGKLAFSSEVKALLAIGVPKHIDKTALNLYFRFLYVPGPRTMLEGVSKLQPGHILRLKSGNLSITRWSEVKEGPYLAEYPAAMQAVRDGVRESVGRQLVSDRPLGVFLSGGIDSTSVLAMMRDTQGVGRIKTFSVGYEATEESDKYNSDANLARRTAEFFGTEHHEFTISGRDVAACFEDIVWHMDEPISNHIQPSTYLLAKFAKPQITVALGGDGGDELFGGYDRYWLSSFIDRVRSLPSPMRHELALRLVEKLSGRKGLTEKIAIPQGMERFFAFIGQKDERASRFIKENYRMPGVGAQVFAPYFDPLWKDFTNQFMAIDAQTWLPNESLVRSDKLTMAHALEERVPLLDLELWKLAYRIPSTWKMNRPSQGKRILVDAMRPYLPPHILKVKKQGFFSPAAKWLRGDLEHFAREVLSDGYAPGSGEYVDLAEARRALDDHISKKQYGLNQVWSIMTFQVWYRRFFS
ncbi:MAG: asparagine synthase (glutamine-hydrolyzing) [Patescibacteria group bacterium]|nr:asparagine synthase (glutamine-hydrolyzing) [Patescibacteria group bacterium]